MKNSAPDGQYFSEIVTLLILGGNRFVFDVDLRIAVVSVFVLPAGTWKNTIELVSQSDGSFRHLCKLSGHKGGITTMAFSGCGTRLYSGGRKDKEIICWDLRVRKLLSTTVYKEICMGNSTAEFVNCWFLLGPW